MSAPLLDLLGPLFALLNLISVYNYDLHDFFTRFLNLLVIHTKVDSNYKMKISPSSKGSWRDYEALLRWWGQGKGSPRGRQLNACDHDGKFYEIF